MSAGKLPVQWLGPVAIVTMPAEIDVSNAAAVREQLLLLLNRGASVLIADMTATTFCDCAGAGAVIRAFRRAGASGAQFRLVSGGPAVQRLFVLLGIDRMADMYSSLAAAIAGQAHPCCAQPQGTARPQNAARPRDTALSQDIPGEDRPQVPKGGG